MTFYTPIDKTPPLNKAMGKLSGIEWFYQEAEFEEQNAEYERLKKICNSADKKTV
ncbi:MAG: hypothetical protein QXQ53_08540 [Candidatus Methanosuratincola sp.]